jgi:hypothetical protein
MFLIFRQHADPVAPRDRKDLVHVGTIVEGDEDKRRSERDGDERVGCHAVRAIFEARGQDGHAAGEAAQRVAEPEWVKRLGACD